MIHKVSWNGHMQNLQLIVIAAVFATTILFLKWACLIRHSDWAKNAGGGGVVIRRCHHFRITQTDKMFSQRRLIICTVVPKF